ARVQACCLLLCSYFFFQAGDGIRAFHVTGVQTCALPISIIEHAGSGQLTVITGATDSGKSGVFRSLRWAFYGGPCYPRIGCTHRSEERRVGKERRARWWSYVLSGQFSRERSDDRRVRETG